MFYGNYKLIGENTSYLTNKTIYKQKQNFEN